MLSGTARREHRLINALGNLGGFFGPYLFGLVKDATGGSFMFALMVIALGPIMSAASCPLGHDRRLEHIPARQASVGREAVPTGEGHHPPSSSLARREILGSSPRMTGKANREPH